MERGLVFFILVESSVKVFSRKLTLRIKEKNTTPQFALFDLIFILLFPKLGTGAFPTCLQLYLSTFLRTMQHIPKECFQNTKVHKRENYRITKRDRIVS